MRMLHIRKYDSAHQARHNAIIGFTMGAYQRSAHQYFSDFYTDELYAHYMCMLYA